MILVFATSKLVGFAAFAVACCCSDNSMGLLSGWVLTPLQHADNKAWNLSHQSHSTTILMVAHRVV